MTSRFHQLQRDACSRALRPRSPALGTDWHQSRRPRGFGVNESLVVATLFTAIFTAMLFTLLWCPPAQASSGVLASVRLLPAAWTALNSVGSVQESTRTKESEALEAQAQKLYDSDDLAGAAALYLELANQTLSVSDRGRFALFAAWILHQTSDLEGRDHAIRLALLSDPALSPSDSAFSAVFLQRVQQVRSDLERDHAQRAYDLTLAAQEALTGKRTSEAIRLYQELLELQPDNLAVRLQLAVTQLNDNLPLDSLRALDPLVRSLETLEPETQQRVVGLHSLARIRSGDLADIESSIRRFTGPSQKQLWLELAAAYQREERWDEAARSYGFVLEIDPADRQTAIYRSQLLGRLGQWRDAEAFLINTSETLPDSAAVWNELGLVRQRLGDTPGAIAAFQRAGNAVDDDPVDRSAREQALASLANELRTSSGAGAREAIDQALTLNPDSINALVVSARLYADQQDHESARRELERAVRLAPERSDVVNSLGNSLYLAGRWQQAIDVFETLLARPSDLSAQGRDAVRENLANARKQLEQHQATSGAASSSARAATSGDTTAVVVGSTPTKTPVPSSAGELKLGLEMESFQWARTGRTVIRVRSVAGDSKGERCGILPGDLVIRIDGQGVTDPESVKRLLSARTSGVRVDLVREDQPLLLVCA